jgi:chromosomal replication initiator protein
LLIDDLQFLSGKRATLIEMLYTINTLVGEGRQLVLTADRPPSELGELGRELVNRLQGGMVCAIDPPDHEVRLGIVRRFAADAGLELSSELQNFVASQVGADARGLGGAINRLSAMQSVLSEPLTLEIARETLADLVQHTARGVKLRDIDAAVCDVFGLDRDSLQSSRRTKDVTHPRMLAMWLARKHTRAALSEIGNYFGGRKHTTVISAQQKVGNWMGEQATLRIDDAQCSVDEAIRRVERKLLG